MPKSRKRPRRHVPHRQGSGDPRRRGPGQSGPGQHGQGEARPIGDQDAHLWVADEDLPKLRRALKAEAQGDAELSLRHLPRASHPVGSTHVQNLQRLVDLGDDAPAWVYSRWIVDQAYRRMLLEGGPRIVRAVVDTLEVAYPDADLDGPFGMSLYDLGSRVATSDWICRQLALFDLGGLADFLDEQAAPSLVERSDRIRQWASTPIRAYRIGQVRRDRLVVTDVAAGEELEILNLGARTYRLPDSHVLGRVVPIAAAPGLMLESRSLDVTPEIAAGVAAAVSGVESERVPGLVPALPPESPAWLGPIALAMRQGRLPFGFSMEQPTPFTSDLCPPGWGEDECNPGLAVAFCDLALAALNLSGPRGVGVMAPHVQAVLVDSAVYAAVRQRLVKPELDEAWTVLSDFVPEPVRSRCRALAELCRQAA